MAPIARHDVGSVGVDVGSTTVKVAARDAPDAPWRTRVTRHHGRAAEAVAALVGELAPPRFGLGVTGSGAAVVTRRCAALAAHEVFAAITFARALHPTAATLIDLGGQDAKLVRFDGPAGAPGRARPAVVMNDRCAAGTGVTIDRCLARLGVSHDEARDVAYEPDAVQALSARCGVFAETDLVNLARRGVPAASLVASLFDAVVRSNLHALARGLTPLAPALLLGGPHAHFPGLADAWAWHLASLWRVRGEVPGLVFVPPEAAFASALGAALAAEGSHAEPHQRDALRRALAAGDGAPAAAVDPPLPQETPTAVERPVWRAHPDGDAGRLVLGVDAGSTVTKAVLVDGARNVRMAVRLASGDAARDAAAVAEAARRALDAAAPGTALEAVAVTGYGAAWMGPLLGASHAVVETVAHAVAARAAAPDAALVCDVGGQDIKVLALDGAGEIERFWVSSRCAAGLGLALETTARELGVARGGVAAAALSARRAPRFGDGCVVFLDADRVSFQRQGFAPEEILAGLVRALPRVVWAQAGRAAAAASGRAVVLQGGVQHNEAAVRAQAERLAVDAPGARVVVHPLPDLAGALGAALFALARPPDGPARPPARRTLPTVAPQLRDAPPCTLCDNRCPRAAISPGGAPADVPAALAGYGCEAGASLDPGAAARSRQARRRAVPDLYGHEAAALFRDDPAVAPAVAPRRRVRFAIPRALALYRAAPLLRAYLRALGAEPHDVRFSPPTSEALWRRGAHHGATDPCFPVKALLAHVHHLVERGGFDALLVPRVTRATTCVRHAVDCASCPVVAASPALVRAAFEAAVAARGARLLDPELDLARPDLLAAQLHGSLGELLGTTRDESDRALDVARRAAARFDNALQARGRVVLDGARDGRGAVLILARPYHVDPGVCHHVGAELAALGYPSLSIRALPRDEAYLAARFADDLARGAIADPFDVRDLLPEADNSGGAERLWGARFAARHGVLGVLDLSSFKCAQDAATAAPVARLLREADVPTCALHDLDETRPRVSLRMALQTFAHAMRRRGLRPWT
ncbi:MAG: BadF/BadG/BcrA/BcrD ATPase family protein [Polyangiales bacterium]